MTRRSALVVVDVQNDFAHPAGALFVAGADRLPPRIDALLAAARGRGDLVVTTQDWHPVGHVSFAATHGLPPFTLRDGDMTWPVHCVADSWGAELVAGLDVANIDHRVLKGIDPGIDRYSGFGGREFSNAAAGRTLEELLRDAGVEELDVAGVATEYCVRATAVDAVRLGFRVRLHAAASRPVDAAAGERAIAEMAAAGIAII